MTEPPEHEIIPLKIEGAFLQPLRVIETPGGPVLHMLRPDFPLLPRFSQGFGEIYFSEVWPGHIKGWKRHKKQTQLFAVPVGLLRIVLVDARADSPCNGAVCDLLLGRPEHYNLLQIPPGVWYAFTALGNKSALICNCADLPHDPTEGEKMPLENLRDYVAFADMKISP